MSSPDGGILGSNYAGTTSTRVTVATNTTLKPGCYFLATNSVDVIVVDVHNLQLRAGGGGRSYTARRSVR